MYAFSPKVMETTPLDSIKPCEETANCRIQRSAFMSHSSFENSFREYLNNQPLSIGYDDNSTSYTDIDFRLKIDEVGFALELKEKKQKYNLLNWEGVHIPEEQFMVIDELSIRKIVLSGASAGLLVKDSVRDKMFFFSMIDLVLMPKIKRFNRPTNFNEKEGIKGKWAIDLRHGMECKDFATVLRAIQNYQRVCPLLGEIPSCLNTYHGETITQGGATRTLDFLNKDVAEK